jgi:hypothetical protein
LSLGDQKDIGEFNLNFLERIEEGLGEREVKVSDEKLKEEPQSDEIMRASTLDFDFTESTDIPSTRGGSSNFTSKKQSHPSI